MTVQATDPGAPPAQRAPERGHGAPPLVVGARRSPTLGRERQLATLLDTLKAAVGHARRMSVVCGEAGIGKSHLLREVLDRARLMDFQVLSCRASDFDAGVAFATLTDLVGATPDVDDAELVAAAAALRAAVEQPGQESGWPVHALVTQWLQALCAGRPTLLALDDAHLADADTLAALSMAVHRCPQLPLVVLATVRPERLLADDVLAATVGRLAEDADGEVVDLAPLDVPDVQALIAATLGGAPDERLTATVYSRSRGNPLFVRETLLSLQGAGAVTLAEGRWRLGRDLPVAPVSRRAALLARVFQQDRDARELARVLSVFRRARLDDLALVCDLAGLPADSVHEVFDRLVEGGVLTADAHGWYEFAHPLIAECLYDDVGPADRRRLHGRVAQHVAAVRGPEAVLELAGHVAEAASPGDTDAVAVLVRASERAAAHAPLAAARWLQRALELLPDGAPETADLLARQTAAYWRGSRPASAVLAGRLALPLLPEGPQRRRTVSTLAVAAHVTGDWQGALDLLEDEGDGPTPDAVAQAQRALLLVQLGRGAEAAALAPAVAQAAPLLPAAVQVVVHTHLGHLANDLGRRADADRATDALVALAPGLSPTGRTTALEAAAQLLAVAGRASAASAVLAQVGGSEQAGWRDVSGAQRYASALASALSGQWASALADLRSADAQHELAGLDSHRVWARLLQARLLIQLGQLDRAAGLLDPADPAPRGWLQEVTRRAYAARLQATRGDASGAVEVLLDLRREVLGSGCFAAVARVLEELALAHVERGDLRAAAAVARELAERAGPDPLPSTRYATGWLVALGERRAEPARAALAVAEAEGARFAAGLCHYALAVLGVDVAVHRAAAAQVFAEAGATRWSHRLAVETGAPSPAVASVPGTPSLTETEVRLARLVQQAMTNREISDTLHYSPKTIEAYLGRLYRKLGCRSRVELVLTIERGELRDLGLAPTADSNPLRGGLR